MKAKQHISQNSKLLLWYTAVNKRVNPVTNLAPHLTFFSLTLNDRTMCEWRPNTLKQAICAGDLTDIKASAIFWLFCESSKWENSTFLSSLRSCLRFLLQLKGLNLWRVDTWQARAKKRRRNLKVTHVQYITLIPLWEQNLFFVTKYEYIYC